MFVSLNPERIQCVPTASLKDRPRANIEHDGHDFRMSMCAADERCDLLGVGACLCFLSVVATAHPRPECH